MVEVGDQAVLRDRRILEAAVERPWQSAFGQDAYPTLDLKAAALYDSISNTQPFLDGNKRAAQLAVQLLYAFAGWYFEAPIDAGYELAMYVANERPVDLQIVADKFAQWRFEVPET